MLTTTYNKVENGARNNYSADNLYARLELVFAYINHAISNYSKEQENLMITGLVLLCTAFIGTIFVSSLELNEKLTTLNASACSQMGFIFVTIVGLWHYSKGLCNKYPKLCLFSS
ncbi:MAG: hypothetical protein WAM14_16970 [Candidatus Nitrosopolaris sp.]